MRLLLVEDDIDLVKTLKKSLEKAGYSVDIAQDGIEAEYLGQEGIYALAILDLGLPQRNGLLVLQNWRAKSNSLPVIILTARDAWHEKVDGFKAGADDYLAKPFHIEELLARIHALILRVNHQPGGILKVGDWLLNEERQQVTLSDNTAIELTGLEFKLLRYFMLHPGKILSKSKLTDQIYDLNSDKDSNVIEVYVNHLRKKLGKDYFETRRGQGYIFNEHIQ